MGESVTQQVSTSASQHFSQGNRKVVIASTDYLAKVDAKNFGFALLLGVNL
jgi:hypothetical protein